MRRSGDRPQAGDKATSSSGQIGLGRLVRGPASKVEGIRSSAGFGLALRAMAPRTRPVHPWTAFIQEHSSVLDASSRMPWIQPMKDRGGGGSAVLFQGFRHVGVDGAAPPSGCKRDRRVSAWAVRRWNSAIQLGAIRADTRFRVFICRRALKGRRSKTGLGGLLFPGGSEHIK